ncbi:MAG: HNH endonuclease, partial [Paludibacteraceae bacterium]|nr:HNH endonuclease [Paludibacteraceae bacterium]
KYLGYSGVINMEYAIRTESNEFLKNLYLTETDFSENQDEQFQDLYFFKKTLRTIGENKKLEQINKEEFCNYILNYVKFLYIDIPEDKATKVFSMMNGNKAEMKSEELIKAELLRLASLNDSDFDKKEENEKNAIEWDNNMLRSRYAREWDKWLQWWNRDDVKKLFKCSNVMGYLISSYLQTVDKNKELSFDNFKNNFLHEQKPIDAKKTFDKLRRLQKRFEDAFNNPKIYNWVGAILRIGNANEFIQWYFAAENKPSDKDIENYYKWSFLGLTHIEIETHRLALCEKQEPKDKDKFDEKFEDLYKILESNDLYNENSEKAFRLLLRLNIDEDNKQEKNKGRKFDFSIWDGNRSLEHIYPKSKVWHKEFDTDGKTEIIKTGDGEKREDSYIDATCIDRESCVDDGMKASEHSIGNLVLLYGKNNSSFGNKDFEEKKHTFFNPSEKDIFESRHLLHTIYKFALSEWNGEQIAKNKYQTLKEFREYYYGK